TAIDAKNLQVKNIWRLAPCEGPSGLAMDTGHRRLFVGCANKIMAVVDADSGKVLATPAIGEGVDATRFDPGTGLAFASCGEGMLTIVKEESRDRFTVVESVASRKGARTMALDTKTHDVYSVTAKFGPPVPASAENPHARRSIVPDTFVVLVFGR
ncbi:MAG TPA: YncE family protein, partial [Terriglobia bacterium]|nr:YncE family protein [Terriglobia bacterium]